MSTIDNIKNGSVVIIVPSFGNKEPVEAVVSYINNEGVQPIINYKFEGGTGWAFYSQIERVLKP